MSAHFSKVESQDSLLALPSAGTTWDADATYAAYLLMEMSSLPFVDVEERNLGWPEDDIPERNARRFGAI
ncbi:hypothetical protein FRB90_007037, partial [Tulasnella sp. 427]